MFNLLNESFARLKRYKTFKVCLLIIIIIPLMIFGMEKILIMDESNANGITSDSAIFFWTGMMPIFIAIAPGLFITSDFKENTVRNKIICGYSRTSIYIANWITASVMSLIMHFTAILVCTIVPGILFGMGDLFAEETIYYFLVSIPVIVSFASITVAITMIFRNSVGAIFSYFIHEILSLFNVVIVLTESESLLKFMAYFLPANQLNMIKYRNYESGYLFNIFGRIRGYKLPEDFDAVALPIYAVIMIVLVTALGIWNFNKKDIK